MPLKVLKSFTEDEQEVENGVVESLSRRRYTAVWAHAVRGLVGSSGLVIAIIVSESWERGQRDCVGGAGGGHFPDYDHVCPAPAPVCSPGPRPGTVSHPPQQPPLCAPHRPLTAWRQLTSDLEASYFRETLTKLCASNFQRYESCAKFLQV